MGVVATRKMEVNMTNLGGRSQRAKANKSLKQNLLIHHGVQVADKQLGADIQRLLLVCARLVDADGLPPQAHLVHDLCSILGILLALELDEAVALVGLGDAVFGQMDVGDAAGLEHELPDEGICDAFIEVADVDGGFFVLFPAGLSAGRRGAVVSGRAAVAPATTGRGEEKDAPMPSRSGHLDQPAAVLVWVEEEESTE